jgi:hypothetical protein
MEWAGGGGRKVDDRFPLYNISIMQPVGLTPVLAYWSRHWPKLTPVIPEYMRPSRLKVSIYSRSASSRNPRHSPTWAQQNWDYQEHRGGSFGPKIESANPAQLSRLSSISLKLPPQVRHLKQMYSIHAKQKKADRQMTGGPQGNGKEISLN